MEEEAQFPWSGICRRGHGWPGEIKGEREHASSLAWHTRPCLALGWLAVEKWGTTSLTWHPRVWQGERSAVEDRVQLSCLSSMEQWADLPWPSIPGPGLPREAGHGRGGASSLDWFPGIAPQVLAGPGDADWGRGKQRPRPDYTGLTMPWGGWLWKCGYSFTAWQPWKSGHNFPGLSNQGLPWGGQPLKRGTSPPDWHL